MFEDFSAKLGGYTEQLEESPELRNLEQSLQKIQASGRGAKEFTMFEDFSAKLGGYTEQLEESPDLRNLEQSLQKIRASDRPAKAFTMFEDFSAKLGGYAKQADDSIRNLEHSLQKIQSSGKSAKAFTMFEDFSAKLGGYDQPKAVPATTLAGHGTNIYDLAATSARIIPASRGGGQVKVDMHIHGSTLDTREERLQVARRLQQEIGEVLGRS